MVVPIRKKGMRLLRKNQIPAKVIQLPPVKKHPIIESVAIPAKLAADWPMSSSYRTAGNDGTEHW